MEYDVTAIIFINATAAAAAVAICVRCRLYIRGLWPKQTILWMMCTQCAQPNDERCQLHATLAPACFMFAIIIASLQQDEIMHITAFLLPDVCSRFLSSDGGQRHGTQCTCRVSSDDVTSGLWCHWMPRSCWDRLSTVTDNRKSWLNFQWYEMNDCCVFKRLLEAMAGLPIDDVNLTCEIPSGKNEN